ncbi:MAG TPA: hypothetical protein VEY93_06790 [Longimicrobium sp.]|nr:hypothetical protein [Longimicrobium sp.]
MLKVANWLLLAASALASAGRPDTSAIVEVVIEHRRLLIDEVTAFDRCAAAAVAGHEPAALDSVFRSRIAAGGLSQWTGECPERSPATAGNKQEARVDSVSVSGSTAQAFVTVWRGEWTHYEVYTVRRRPNAILGWGVEAVRLWGWIQVDPIIPAPG